MSHWFTPPSQFYGDCWWLCSEDGELCWWSCREDGELCWWLHSEDGELMPHWFTCPSVQSFVENAGDYAVRMVNWCHIDLLAPVFRALWRMLVITQWGWWTDATLIYLPQCSELCGECWWLRSEDGEQPTGHADQRSTLSYQPHPGAGQPHPLRLFFFIVSFFFISFSSSFFFCLVSPFNILKTDAFSACWVIQWFHNPPNSDLDYRM